MDKQKIILYAKKLKIALIILLVGLIICGVLLKKLIPGIADVISKNKEISAQTTAIDEKTKKLAELKKSIKEKSEQKNDVVKEIYKPAESSLSTEAAIAEEFADILKMIRANSVKVLSLKYNYNPSNDNFVKNAANKYNVCLLNLEMIADYKHFQSFLSDLYKHEHFLELSDIEIVPYEKDKKILLIKSDIKLYSQKDGADAAPKETETKDDAQTAENKPDETKSET